MHTVAVRISLNIYYLLFGRHAVKMNIAACTLFVVQKACSPNSQQVTIVVM